MSQSSTIRKYLNPLARNSILSLAMVVAAWLGSALQPTHKVKQELNTLDLETLVPNVFGQWRADVNVSPLIVDPGRAELISRIYSQTLTRTYVNDKGYRIILSIAYGGDQSDAMQVHKPELCYPAQGFTLIEKTTGTLEFHEGTIPVTRLVATLNQRHEPVTYWITVGDHAIRSSGVQKKLIEMSYRLNGTIPDGMLVRASSIDQNTANAYEMHDQFLKQLLGILPPDARRRVAGI